MRLIEIDYFKRLNTIYGYDAANAMLEKVAHHIKTAGEDYFERPAMAFHPHGDEFYLIGHGPAKDENVANGLDLLRRVAAQLRIPVADIDEPMSVTVTIGWVFSSDLDGDQYSEKGILKSVEKAADFGKMEGRNRTLRYDESMKKHKLHSDRGELQ